MLRAVAGEPLSLWGLQLESGVASDETLSGLLLDLLACLRNTRLLRVAFDSYSPGRLPPFDTLLRALPLLTAAALPLPRQDPSTQSSPLAALQPPAPDFSALPSLGRLQALRLILPRATSVPATLNASQLVGVRNLALHGSLAISNLRALARNTARLELGPLQGNGIGPDVPGDDLAIAVNAGSSITDLRLAGVRELPPLTAFANLQRLHLRHCANVRDVAPLADIPELRLEHLPEVDDVSSLGRCRLLSLIRCVSVRDVSALGHVDTLLLDHCMHLRDVSALTHNRVLSLAHCVHVMQPPPLLARCDSIILTDCVHVRDVRPLAAARHVGLAGCAAVMDVRPLAAPGARCVSVDLRRCPMARTVLLPQLQGSGIQVML